MHTILYNMHMDDMDSEHIMPLVRMHPTSNNAQANQVSYASY